MREDINFKGADTESDFWLISIVTEGFNHEITTTQLRLSEIVVNTRALREGQNFRSISSFPLPHILQAG